MGFYILLLCLVSDTGHTFQRSLDATKTINLHRSLLFHLFFFSFAGLRLKSITQFFILLCFCILRPVNS